MKIRLAVILAASVIQGLAAQTDFSNPRTFSTELSIRSLEPVTARATNLFVGLKSCPGRKQKSRRSI